MSEPLPNAANSSDVLRLDSMLRASYASYCVTITTGVFLGNMCSGRRKNHGCGQKKNPVLKGFSIACYLSIAGTVRVTEESIIEISTRAKNLQTNFPTPKPYNGDIRMVMTSLTAMFSNRKFIGVCMSRVLCAIRTPNASPIKPIIKNGMVVQKRMISRLSA